MGLHKQAASLAVMHAADVLQPLLILPYAGRVLGPAPFGQYAYAMSLGALAATLVEYGFHWTAQRAAASARREPAVIASLFAEVIATKGLLWLFLALFGLVASGGLLAISKSMFLCIMLTPLGGILFPPWLFIGLERAWQAAVAVVVARILACVLFLIMVTSPAQVELAVAIQSGVPIVSGIVSLPFVLSVGLHGFRSVTLSGIGKQLLNGWRGFLFTLVERALITLPVPLVQHFAGYVAAGQYSLAEKFVAAARPLFRVVSDTFLPRVAYCARHDPAAGIALIRRSLLTPILGGGLCLFMLFVAPYLIVFFFGQEFSGAIPIVRVMSVLPVLINVNICTSNLYMFNYGHERAWTFLTVSGLLVFLVSAYILSAYFLEPGIGVAVALIARESVVLAVSAGFFLAFASSRARGFRPEGARAFPPSGVALRPALLNAGRFGRPWRALGRSEP